MPAREAEGIIVAAHVMHERAAAAFAFGKHSFDTVPVEEAHRRFIDRRRKHGLRAAGEHGDTCARRAVDGNFLRILFAAL